MHGMSKFSVLSLPRTKPVNNFDRFLPSLKDKCLRTPGNPEFWSDVKTLGRDISLISNKEARKYGGAASVSERRAEEVRHRRTICQDIEPSAESIEVCYLTLT
jgi:hypothetical protein